MCFPTGVVCLEWWSWCVVPQCLAVCNGPCLFFVVVVVAAFFFLLLAVIDIMYVYHMDIGS